MKKWTWIIVIAIAAIFVVPMVVYAFDYTNEYEVDVSFTISSSALGTVDITNVETEATAMGYMTFWDTLRGHSSSQGELYLVYVEIAQDGSDYLVTEAQLNGVAVGESDEMSFKLFEVKPGDSTLRIYVHSKLTDSIVFDQSYDVLIG